MELLNIEIWWESKFGLEVKIKLLIEHEFYGNLSVPTLVNFKKVNDKLIIQNNTD